MNPEYTYTRKGSFSFPGGYEDHFEIIVKSDDEKLYLYLQHKVSEIITEYKKELYGW